MFFLMFEVAQDEDGDDATPPFRDFYCHAQWNWIVYLSYATIFLTYFLRIWRTFAIYIWDPYTIQQHLATTRTRTRGDSNYNHIQHGMTRHASLCGLPLPFQCDCCDDDDCFPFRRRSWRSDSNDDTSSSSSSAASSPHGTRVSDAFIIGDNNMNTTALLDPHSRPHSRSPSPASSPPFHPLMNPALPHHISSSASSSSSSSNANIHLIHLSSSSNSSPLRRISTDRIYTESTLLRYMLIVLVILSILKIILDAVGYPIILPSTGCDVTLSNTWYWILLDGIQIVIWFYFVWKGRTSNASSNNMTPSSASSSSSSPGSIGAWSGTGIGLRDDYASGLLTELTTLLVILVICSIGMCIAIFFHDSVSNMWFNLDLLSVKTELIIQSTIWIIRYLILFFTTITWPIIQSYYYAFQPLWSNWSVKWWLLDVDYDN